MHEIEVLARTLDDACVRLALVYVAVTLPRGYHVAGNRAA
jgi:hypothetical protein